MKTDAVTLGWKNQGGLFSNISCWAVSGIICFFFLISACQTSSTQIRPLSKAEAECIGLKIFKNEADGKKQNLTSWNVGEEFPSLGIGHFIWYPVGFKGPFTETFPELLSFLEKQNIKLPDWILKLPNRKSPWRTRSEFLKDLDSPRMNELRDFLESTIDYQTFYIVDRLHEALPRMLKAAPRARENEIRKKFYQVANAPGGSYVLIDYLNFKGEGTNPKERYRDQGWGLLQVLEGMNCVNSTSPCEDFARSASLVLERRVRNAPPERGEKRWLKGWKNRIKTYTKINCPN